MANINDDRRMKKKKSLKIQKEMKWEQNEWKQSMYENVLGPVLFVDECTGNACNIFVYIS